MLLKKACCQILHQFEYSRGKVM